MIAGDIPAVRVFVCECMLDMYARRVCMYMMYIHVFVEISLANVVPVYFVNFTHFTDTAILIMIEGYSTVVQ